LLRFRKTRLRGVDADKVFFFSNVFCVEVNCAIDMSLFEHNLWRRQEFCWWRSRLFLFVVSLVFISFTPHSFSFFPWRIISKLGFSFPMSPPPDANPYSRACFFFVQLPKWMVSSMASALWPGGIELFSLELALSSVIFFGQCVFRVPRTLALLSHEFSY